MDSHAINASSRGRSSGFHFAGSIFVNRSRKFRRGNGRLRQRSILPRPRVLRQTQRANRFGGSQHERRRRAVGKYEFRQFIDQLDRAGIRSPAE